MAASLKAAEDGCSLKATQNGCSLTVAEDGCSLKAAPEKLFGAKGFSRKEC